MTISRAIAKLRKNGWTVNEAESPIRAFKHTQRDIYLHGNREDDWLDLIVVKIYYGNYQFDTSSDSRYCDTIKEAMRAA